MVARRGPAIKRHRLSLLRGDAQEVLQRLQVEATGATVHRARNIAHLVKAGLSLVLHGACTSDCSDICPATGEPECHWVVSCPLYCRGCTRAVRRELDRSIMAARAWLWKNKP